MTDRLDLLTRGQKNWVEKLLLSKSPLDEEGRDRRMLERIQSVLLNKKVRGG